MRVLDVGAHNGEVAQQLACLFRPEFMGLVEPLPQMVKALRSRSFAPRQSGFDNRNLPHPGVSADRVPLQSVVSASQG